jgi:dihydropteroate synthase
MAAKISIKAPASSKNTHSVVAAVLAVQQGASVVRVHDVHETVQALKVLMAVNASKPAATLQ